eukprot:s3142_g5.t1
MLTELRGLGRSWRWPPVLNKQVGEIWRDAEPLPCQLFLAFFLVCGTSSQACFDTTPNTPRAVPHLRHHSSQSVKVSMTGTSKGPTYVPLEVTTRCDDDSEVEMGYQHLPFSQRVARRQRRQGRPRSIKAKLIGGVVAACIVAAFVSFFYSA